MSGKIYVDRSKNKRRVPSKKVETDVVPKKVDEQINKLEYLKENASCLLHLIEPPARLSIAELYGFVKQIEVFFEDYPADLEIIKDCHRSGWSFESIYDEINQHHKGVVTPGYIKWAIDAPNPPGYRFQRRFSGSSKPTSQDFDWSPEMKKLIDWFLSDPKLPQEPFKINPWETINEPQKHYDRLKRDIANGPTGSRVMYCSLQLELDGLYRYANDLESLNAYRNNYFEQLEPPRKELVKRHKQLKVVTVWSRQSLPSQQLSQQIEQKPKQPSLTKMESTIVDVQNERKEQIQREERRKESLVKTRQSKRKIKVDDNRPEKVPKKPHKPRKIPPLRRP